MSSTDRRPLVTVTRHGDGGHVAELVLDRPEAMNAVSTAMARDLGAACAALAADETVRCVVRDQHQPQGVLRGRRPEGAQQLQRRRPDGSSGRWPARRTAAC